MRNGIQEGMADAWAEFEKYKKSEIDTGQLWIPALSAKLLERLEVNRSVRRLGAIYVLTL